MPCSASSDSRSSRSLDGQQPARYGRWTVVFNGEIYNYRELRDELAAIGATVATDSEAEVLAAAFHALGPVGAAPAAGHVRARGVGRQETGTGYAARDPFGIKPLYHLRTPDGLYLASEKKALLPFAGDRRPGRPRRAGALPDAAVRAGAGHPARRPCAGCRPGTC